MKWNFDLSLAPRDRKLWLATKCGKVSATRWDGKREAWSGMSKGEAPIAWQPYGVPMHPHHMVPADLAGAADIALIDDCGGGA